MQTGELLFHLLSALGAALVGAGVALRLGQPIIVGYLLAGAAIGPLTPGFIGDADAISEIAEVGVSLLMFVVGILQRSWDCWSGALARRSVFVRAPVVAACPRGSGGIRATLDSRPLAGPRGLART